MKFLSPWVVASFSIASITLSSCSPEKAKAVRVGAVQFKNESFACVDAIDVMRQRELEPVPRTPVEVQQDFAANLWMFNPENLRRLADRGDPVSFLRDPNSVELSEEAKKAWKGFLVPMKEQYSAFAAIFDKLEKGYLLAADAVEDSIEPAEKLTVQMAGIAQSIAENPPLLIQYRTNVSNKLINLKEEYQDLAGTDISDPSLQSFRDRAIELLGAWEQVEKQEQELLEATVTPCLKAASLGKDLLPLIRSYRDLDLDTINSFIAEVLNLAGLISGQDFPSLQLKITGVIGDIKSDEDMLVVVETLLDEINSEIRNRNPDSGDANAASAISFWQSTLAEAEMANLFKAPLPQSEAITFKE